MEASRGSAMFLGRTMSWYVQHTCANMPKRVAGGAKLCASPCSYFVGWRSEVLQLDPLIFKSCLRVGQMKSDYHHFSAYTHETGYNNSSVYS